MRFDYITEDGKTITLDTSPPSDNTPGVIVPASEFQAGERKQDRTAKSRLPAARGDGPNAASVSNILLTAFAQIADAAAGQKHWAELCNAEFNRHWQEENGK